MDDRWNGGGFIAPFALERLRRELVTLDVNREGAVTTEPQEVLNGPKIALLNHWSASDGDIFPDLFKRYHLGPLLGTRSWGGVRGIRGELEDDGWRLRHHSRKRRISPSDSTLDRRRTAASIRTMWSRTNRPTFSPAMTPSSKRRSASC